MTSLSKKGKKARKRVWRSKTNPLGARKGKQNVRWSELPGRRVVLSAKQQRPYYVGRNKG